MSKAGWRAVKGRIIPFLEINFTSNKFFICNFKNVSLVVKFSLGKNSLYKFVCVINCKLNIKTINLLIILYPNNDEVIFFWISNKSISKYWKVKMLWCYFVICLFGAIILSYAFLELHYFFRMCLSMVLARFFKKKINILDKITITG